MRWSERLGRLVVRHGARTLLGALLLTLALLPALARLRLDTDLVDLFPRTSASAQAFARFSRAFVADRSLVVLLLDDDPRRLTELADRYAAALAASPRVTEVRHKLGGAAGVFLRDHVLGLLTESELDVLAARTTPEALATQARRLRSLLSAPGGSSLAPMLTADPLELLPLVSGRLEHGLPVDPRSGYFKSSDGRALLLFVRPKELPGAGGIATIEADRALLEEAGAIAARLGIRVTDGRFAATGSQLGFTGAAAYSVTYRDWLHRDTSLATSLSAVTVLVLFAVFFRALRALPLVAAPLLVGLAWTGASAALLYGRVNAVSLAFGTILLSIGIDLPIQLYNRLREELGHRPPLEALEHTISELSAPSVTATLGPAAVFFSCALSDYRGLGELGVLAGIGLLLNCVAMLTVFPALLAVLPPRLWAGPPLRTRTDRVLRLIGSAAAARPRAFLAVAFAVGAAAIPLALHLRFDRRLLQQPAAMPPVRVQAELERRFGEHERAAIALVEDRGPEPALERADAWLVEVERLRKAGLVRSYQSISALFPSLATQARRRAHLAQLDPAKRAQQLEAALVGVGFDPEPFAPFLRQLRDPPEIRLTEARAAGLDFLVRAQVQDGADGIRQVATYVYPEPEAEPRTLAALERFAAGPVGGVVTGRPILEDTLRAIAEHDLRKVTLVSTLAVALLLALYYRRLRPWVATMLPLTLAWVLFAGALAALDLPLNLFNLLAVPLVIGYGIDDHVFMVHRHLHDPEADPARTLGTIGRAVILTSMATIAGFLPLGVARYDGLRLLGLSGALAVALCLFAALAVLPALLAILWPVKGGPAS